MTNILANSAALHQAYWDSDIWYRRAWYFWPQASSLLALLLIFNPTTNPGAAPEAPWVKPVAPGNSPGAGTKSTNASEADRAACSGKDPDAAIAVCARLIETLGRSDSWLAEAYFMRGRAYNQKGLRDLAVADLTETIALAPPAAGGVNLRGAIYLDQKRYDPAIADFQAALAAKPGWALPHANLGLAYLRKNDVDRAILEANEALRLEPTLTWARIVRMRINSQRKQFAEVIADATAVIASAPTNGEAFFFRGEARVELSDFRAAAADLQEATRLGYKSVFLELNRAYVNEKLGNLDQALLDYTAALKLDPRSVYALQKRAEIYFNKGIYADASANTTTILEIDPKNYDALVLRAKAAEAAGSHEAALSDIDVALSLQPRDAVAHYLRGAIYFNAEMARVGRCQKHGRPSAAVTGRPDRAGVSDCRQGPDIAGAIKEFDEALQLKADLAAAYVDRGMAYILLGNRQQASVDWRTAYKLDPSNKDLLARMQRARITP